MLSKSHSQPFNPHTVCTWQTLVTSVSTSYRELKTQHAGLQQETHSLRTALAEARLHNPTPSPPARRKARRKAASGSARVRTDAVDSSSSQEAKVRAPGAPASNNSLKLTTFSKHHQAVQVLEQLLAQEKGAHAKLQATHQCVSAMCNTV